MVLCWTLRRRRWCTMGCFTLSYHMVLNCREHLQKLTRYSLYKEGQFVSSSKNIVHQYENPQRACIKRYNQKSYIITFWLLITEGLEVLKLKTMFCDLLLLSLKCLILVLMALWTLCVIHFTLRKMQSYSIDNGFDERLEITEGPTLINNWD